MGRPVSKTIVIARYKEDVSWTKDLIGWRVIIVQKQADTETGDIPNAGREPASFCFAIAKYYDEIKPSQTWAFVQGNPFDHCPGFRDKLEQPITGYTPLGGEHMKTTDGTGNPDHPNLPIKEKFKEWFGLEFEGTLEYAPGGQFMVKGKDILRHPKDSYIYLMDDVTTAWNAWVAERVWSVVFRANISTNE
jgi:hypothetical protein